MLLSSCSTFQFREKISLEELQHKVALDGEGRTRIETQEEQYVVPFESAFDEQQKNWMLVLYPPLNPEIPVEFSHLNTNLFNAHQNSKAIEGLENLVRQQQLGFKGIGKKLGEHFHTYLRWVYAQKLKASFKCSSKQQGTWACMDGKQSLLWTWEKDILVGQQVLGQGWITKLIFRNAGEKNFQRVTFEIIQEASRPSEQVKFRQEFFFSK